MDWPLCVQCGERVSGQRGEIVEVTQLVCINEDGIWQIIDEKGLCADCMNERISNELDGLVI